MLKLDFNFPSRYLKKFKCGPNNFNNMVIFQSGFVSSINFCKFLGPFVTFSLSYYLYTITSLYFNFFFWLNRYIRTWGRTKKIILLRLKFNFWHNNIKFNWISPVRSLFLVLHRCIFRVARKNCLVERGRWPMSCLQIEFQSTVSFSHFQYCSGCWKKYWISLLASVILQSKGVQFTAHGTFFYFFSFLFCCCCYCFFYIRL